MAEEKKVEVKQTSEGFEIKGGEGCPAMGVSIAYKNDGSVFIMIRVADCGEEATKIQPFGGGPGCP